MPGSSGCIVAWSFALLDLILEQNLPNVGECIGVSHPGWLAMG